MSENNLRVGNRAWFTLPVCLIVVAATFWVDHKGNDLNSIIFNLLGILILCIVGMMENKG